jgi:hypothetical protein
MHDRVPGLDRLRLLTSCLVPLADCIDLFPEADRSEVLMWALMVLRFTTIDWEEQRGDQLQPLFTDLMKAHESLKSAVRWHADHVQVMRQIVEKYSATAGSVDGSYGSGRAN